VGNPGQHLPHLSGTPFTATWRFDAFVVQTGGNRRKRSASLGPEVGNHAPNDVRGFSKSWSVAELNGFVQDLLHVSWHARTCEGAIGLGGLPERQRDSKGPVSPKPLRND
jgi:hypothetical protein